MKLSRSYIRKLIIAEARKKAPLLPGNLSDDTEELELDDIELTQDLESINIEKSDKISDLFDEYELGFDEYDDDDDDDFEIDDGEELSFTEEDSESMTAFPASGISKAAYDFRIPDDSILPADPEGRTLSQIRKDVFSKADEVEKNMPRSQKTDNQREAEFLRRMSTMASDNAPEEYPTDPEFAPLAPDDTMPLASDRLTPDDETKTLEETIHRLIRKAIITKVIKNNKSVLSRL